MNNKEINLIEIFTVLIKWRKTIVINIIIAAVLSVGISLLLPNWYQAEAIVLPPLKQDFSIGLGSLGQIAGNLFGSKGYELPMLSTQSDVFVTILNSRGVAVKILKEYDLMNRYKEKNLDKAIKKFNSHSMIELGPEGSIQISFEVKEDPRLAAKITNSFIYELDKINSRITRSYAEATRKFIGNRLDETKLALKIAEEELCSFQKEHGTISIKDQIRVTIESTAQLMAEMMAAKIELGVLKMTLGSSHKSVNQLQIQINQIELMINKLKSGTEKYTTDTHNFNKEESELFIPLNELPDLGLQIVRLMRDIKIQEILFELLIQQHEQAKIKEKESTPTVQVLEYAEPPTYKSRPRRSIIVISSVIFFFFLSGFIAFLLESYRKGIHNQEPSILKLKSLLDDLKSDFRKKQIK